VNDEGQKRTPAVERFSRLIRLWEWFNGEKGEDAAGAWFAWSLGVVAVAAVLLEPPRERYFDVMAQVIPVLFVAGAIESATLRAGRADPRRGYRTAVVLATCMAFVGEGLCIGVIGYGADDLMERLAFASSAAGAFGLSALIVHPLLTGTRYD